MRQSYEMTIGVSFDNTASDSVDDLEAEMKGVKEAVTKALETHVPRSYRGALRVWIRSAAIAGEGE